MQSKRLVVEGLKKSFGTLQVLRDVHATFEMGRIHGLLGRNGAGKTTFFSLLYGDLLRDAGSVWLEEGEARKPLDPDSVGMLFAEPILPDFLTAYEYLQFVQDLTQTREVERLRLWLQRLSFAEEDLHRLIRDFSSGMKAKLSILSLLLFGPPVLLLDEPLTSLDVVVAAEVKSLLREFAKERVIILSTHITALAQELCDEVVLLRGGVLQEVAVGPDFEAEVLRILAEDGEDQDEPT